MTILIVLIPLGLLMLLVAIGAFVWAVSDGQYEDLEGEGARILFDDELSVPTSHRVEARDAPDEGDPR